MMGDRLHHRQRRRFGADPCAEGRHRAGGALDLGDHPVAGVADVTREPQLTGQTEYERPEADSLHDPRTSTLRRCAVRVAGPG